MLRCRRTLCLSGFTFGSLLGSLFPMTTSHHCIEPTSMGYSNHRLVDNSKSWMIDTNTEVYYIACVIFQSFFDLSAPKSGLHFTNVFLALYYSLVFGVLQPRWLNWNPIIGLQQTVAFHCSSFSQSPILQSRWKRLEILLTLS